MIVPMKKLTLLVLKNEQRQALKDLRKLGLVHIEDKPASGTLINELNSEKNDLMFVQSILTEYLPKKQTKTEPSLLNEEDTLSFVDSVLDLTSSYKANTEEISKLKAELSTYSAWGDFDPKDFDFLTEKGIYLFPASISEKAYKNLSKEVKTIKTGTSKNLVRFMIWSETNDLPKDLPSELVLLKLPEISISEIRERIKTLETKISAYKTEMVKMSAYLNSVKALDKIVNKKLQFEIIHEGMEEVGLKEVSGGEVPASAKLVWLRHGLIFPKSLKMKTLFRQN